MILERIDLYEYFNVQRGSANGGFLNVYARSASAETGNIIRPAVLIMPGGGYEFVSDRENEPVALKFMNSGFACFVLQYSVFASYPVPLVEAQMAVSYIRANYEKYSINPKAVCTVGFSAGGHLAGMLATIKDDDVAAGGVNVKAVMPDAVALCYPVITMGKFTSEGTRRVITGGNTRLYEKLSVEERVDGNSAPAFIWHTGEDNGVPVENSLCLALKYREHGVPFSLHVFEKGPHGLSLADDETCRFGEKDSCLYSVGKWFELLIDWLNSRGFKTEIGV